MGSGGSQPASCSVARPRPRFTCGTASPGSDGRCISTVERQWDEGEIQQCIAQLAHQRKYTKLLSPVVNAAVARTTNQLLREGGFRCVARMASTALRYSSAKRSRV